MIDNIIENRYAQRDHYVAQLE
jgi:ABC-type glutathione transport system ATPase component